MLKPHCEDVSKKGLTKYIHLHPSYFSMKTNFGIRFDFSINPNFSIKFDFCIKPNFRI